MTVDLKRLLNTDDKETLYGGQPTNWVPKDPRELILPYITEKVEEEELSSVEVRREKAYKVINGYDKIIESCEKLEEEIEQRCKSVTITLTPSKHLNVIEAIGRLFGIESQEITFDMYKQCVQKLAKMSNDNVPMPGDK